MVVDEVGDQLEKVDNAYQCPAAGAKADRSVAGSQEVGPQSVHCRGHVRGRADVLDPVGQRRAHSSDMTAQFVVVPRGRKNNAAGTHITTAISQPSSRSLIGPTGVQTGQT